MKRRKFNRLIRNYALAQTLFPPIFQSCQKEEEIYIPYDGEIAIIGAGAAGLYAAQLLQSKGYNFTIYEASDKIGGRLGKVEDLADFPIDLGAQWLHGKNNLQGELIQSTNTSITEDNSDQWVWFEKQIRKDPPDDVFALFEKENGLPDISFLEFAAENGFGDSYKYLVEAIAGDSGASASKISAYWKIKEEENWDSGDEDYKFAQTYYDLVYDHVAKPLLNNIKLQSPITSIDYSLDEILLRSAGSDLYKADKVIITVPIPILQSEMIQFLPPLPQNQKQAIQKIGMEPGMKVFLKFSQNFYKENLLGGEICAAYADERIGKTGNDHVMLAFVMGEQATKLSALGRDEAIIRALLAELDQMYEGKASLFFLKGLVKDWSAEPYIKGAYSYSTIGIGDARKQASRPVANKLFFAGEAMHTNGHHQTVFGAAQTGLQAVKAIFEGL